METVPNFDLKLKEWADEQVGRELVWGETDCASLAKRALQIAWDPDPTRDAPNWTTRLGALRHHTRQDGISGALEAMEEVEEVPVAFVRQGDILVRDDADPDGIESCGVVIGQAVLVCDYVSEEVMWVPKVTFADGARCFRPGGR